MFYLETTVLNRLYSEKFPEEKQVILQKYEKNIITTNINK